MGVRQAVRSPWLRFVVLLGVVLVAVFLFLDEFDVSGVVTEIYGANLGLVAVAVVVYAVSWYPRGIRYRDLLVAMGYRMSTIVMTGAVFVSQTANLVFPARAGDATRAYVVKKRSGVPYATGAASLTAERFLDVVVVGGFAALGVVGALFVGGAVEVRRHSEILVGSVLLVLVVVAGTVALVVASRSDFGRVGSRLPFVTERVSEVIGGFVDDVAATFDDSARFVRLAGASIVAWGLDVAAGALVFYAVGTTGWVVFPAALVGVSVGNLAKAVPSTPGGVGVYEAGFAASVTALLPIGWEVAVAVAVVDHALKNGVTVLGGVVSATLLNVSLTQRADSGVEEPS